MTKLTIPTLQIGNLKICPPIIQGGMGVRVSGANLASAVANDCFLQTINDSHTAPQFNFPVMISRTASRAFLNCLKIDL